MLSLWFWLERWFTDVPGFWAILGRVIVTVFVLTVAIIAVGIAFDVSGEVVAPCLVVTMIGSFVWAGWAASTIGGRAGARARKKFLGR